MRSRTPPHTPARPPGAAGGHPSSKCAPSAGGGAAAAGYDETRQRAPEWFHIPGARGCRSEGRARRSRPTQRSVALQDAERVSLKASSTVCVTEHGMLGAGSLPRTPGGPSPKAGHVCTDRTAEMIHIIRTSSPECFERKPKPARGCRKRSACHCASHSCAPHAAPTHVLVLPSHMAMHWQRSPSQHVQGSRHSCCNRRPEALGSVPGMEGATLGRQALLACGALIRELPPPPQVTRQALEPHTSRHERTT